MFVFEGSADTFRGSIISKDETTLYSFSYACYANCFNMAVISTLQNVDAKWYEIYWSDALSLVEKNRKKTKKIIELLSSTGIFRNTEILLIEEKDVPNSFKNDDFYNFTNKAPYWIRLRHDVDKCTGEEMFFVGSIIRTFSLYPDVLLRFLKLYKMYDKKYSISHLFLIAHSIHWEKEGFYLDGHRLVNNNFSILTGKTFENFLEDLDKDPIFFLPIRTTKGYSRKSVDSFFVTILVTEGKYGRMGNSMARWKGTKFSRNIIKTYFDEKYFRKVYSKNRNLISSQ